MPKLTKPFCDTVKPPATGYEIHWDDKVSGYGLRVTASEVKAFVAHPPRVVRSVGWRVCMTCSKPFFSDDVIALRMCAGCKAEGPKRDSPNPDTR